MRTALTIAGSDSGGGAGIQADLKTFSALGVFGMSVITAVTAQNTREVRSVQQIDLAVIKDQLEAVFDDIGADAVKIGMLASADIVDVVAQALERYRPHHIVLDPVMISKGGHHLVDDDAVDAIKERLLPLASLVTPNLPEAEVLTGGEIQSEDDMMQAGLTIQAMGAGAVLVKGGHLSGDANDVLFNGQNFHWFRAKRIDTKNTHGTGCTLSSAIAAHLALAKTEDDPVTAMLDAVEKAKAYMTTAIRHSLDLGSGHGPTHHFYDIYKKAGLLNR